jgi:hypothetical protein
MNRDDNGPGRGEPHPVQQPRSRLPLPPEAVDMKWTEMTTGQKNACIDSFRAQRLARDAAEAEPAANPAGGTILGSGSCDAGMKATAPIANRPGKADAATRRAEEMHAEYLTAGGLGVLGSADYFREVLEPTGYDPDAPGPSRTAADIPACIHGVPSSPCGICGEFTEDRWQAAKTPAETATGRVLRIALQLAGVVAAGLVIAVCVAVLITIHRDHSGPPVYVPAIFTPSPAATQCPAGQYLAWNAGGLPECAK